MSKDSHYIAPAVHFGPSSTIEREPSDEDVAEMAGVSVELVRLLRGLELPPEGGKFFPGEFVDFSDPNVRAQFIRSDGPPVSPEIASFPFPGYVYKKD